MAHHNILRISREVAQIQSGTDLSIAVAHHDSNMRQVQALIVGPPETPYEYGFFEFRVKFGPEYPSKPPRVDAMTTNSGRCRFNPNIYAGGKVCLSILGTWEGARGEEWSSAQGLESLLLSIQSLMSNNPYENEPGFEQSKGDIDKEIREAYCAKIRHETLRIAVIQKLESMLGIQPDVTVPKKEQLEPSYSNKALDKEGEDAESTSEDTKLIKFEPFNDLEKRRFLWYYESYLSAIEEHTPKHEKGEAFAKMPFEGGPNSMTGHFQYEKLSKRLVRIKKKLQQETENWTKEGLQAVEQELSIAYNLQNQFLLFRSFQQQKNIHNIDVTLLEGNPFVWIMTYFGRSGSDLDGGMFRVRISLSPRFPVEQPRVIVETKLYHHRVSKDGVLCYFPTKTDEVKHHIQAIVLAIEEVSPPYDPRAIVHPEATHLFWGNDNDKKTYSRAQRRSAQDSMDEMTV